MVKGSVFRVLIGFWICEFVAKVVASSPKNWAPQITSQKQSLNLKQKTYNSKTDKTKRGVGKPKQEILSLLLARLLTYILSFVHLEPRISLQVSTLGF